MLRVSTSGSNDAATGDALLFHPRQCFCQVIGVLIGFVLNKASRGCEAVQKIVVNAVHVADDGLRVDAFSKALG